MKRAWVYILIMIASSTSVMGQIEDGKNKALESIGVLSAVTIYNTYLAIGAVADGYGTAYEDDYVVSLMEEQKSLLANTIDQLNLLTASDYLDTNDKEFVKQTTDCLNYLKMEAEAMSKYVGSKTQADLDSYNFYRDRAWNMIEDLLGLGGED